MLMGFVIFILCIVCICIWIKYKMVQEENKRLRKSEHAKQDINIHENSLNYAEEHHDMNNEKVGRINGEGTDSKSDSDVRFNAINLKHLDIAFNQLPNEIELLNPVKITKDIQESSNSSSDTDIITHTRTVGQVAVKRENVNVVDTVK